MGGDYLRTGRGSAAGLLWRAQGGHRVELFFEQYGEGSINLVVRFWIDLIGVGKAAGGPKRAGG